VDFFVKGGTLCGRGAHARVARQILRRLVRGLLQIVQHDHGISWFQRLSSNQGATPMARRKNYEIFLWHICFALLHSRALEESKQILKRDHKEKNDRQITDFRHGGDSWPTGVEIQIHR
jgi:hypothetical protein